MDKQKMSWKRTLNGIPPSKLLAIEAGSPAASLKPSSIRHDDAGMANFEEDEIEEGFLSGHYYGTCTY